MGSEISRATGSTSTPRATASAEESAAKPAAATTKASTESTSWAARTGGAARAQYKAPVALKFVASTQDDVLGTERMLSPGAIVPSKERAASYSVKDLVDDVIKRADGAPVRALSLSGHGSIGRQLISDRVVISAAMLPEDEAQLARLKPLFEKGAEVTLEGCSVGATPDGEALLKRLATLWGVKVRAGIIPQLPIPGLEGSSNVAVPGVNGAEPTIVRERSVANRFFRQVKDHHDVDTLFTQASNALAAELDGRFPVDIKRHHYYLTKLLDSADSPQRADIVVGLFRGVSPTERRQLYTAIEARPWQGDFHRSALPFQTDDLHEALPAKQREELKALLNATS